MKSRKFFIGGAVCLVVMFLSQTCFGNDGFDYQLKGNIRGLKDDSVILFIRHFDKNKNILTDTLVTVAKNDEFLIKGYSGGVYDAYVVSGGFRSRKGFTVFIEKGSILVKGHRDFWIMFLSPALPEMKNTMRIKFEDRIYARMRTLQNQMKEADEAEKKRLSTEMNAWRDSISVGRMQFIATHPGSPASAIYLYVAQDNIPVEQLESLYNKFSPTVKGISFVRMIPEKIEARKRSAIGNMAPEFAAMDLSGKSFNLSAYRGKYVLLEFWASWCVPCRAENPDLLRAHKNIQDKGFVRNGHFPDDKKDKWEKAIAEDQLPWIHISELNAFDNKVAKLYGVQPIPDNFLIDPQGKIIARRLNGKEVERRLAEEIH